MVKFFGDTKIFISACFVKIPFEFLKDKVEIFLHCHIWTSHIKPNYSSKQNMESRTKYRTIFYHPFEENKKTDKKKKKQKVKGYYNTC